MLEVCSLASGSNGNAFFIKTGGNAFLVDSGISCKQICLRLEKINHSLDDIKGIFITHEHSDHVQGLRVLLKKRSIPIYISSKTYRRIRFPIPEENLNLIESFDTVSVQDTKIQFLPKTHDASDPSLVSFHYQDRKVSVITDVGSVCQNVIQSVRDADIVFLEFNHDELMLHEGSYPPFLKRRIAGRHGHLSNTCAAKLVSEYASPRLQYLFLSHLSENNNTPQKALSTLYTSLASRKDLKELKTIVSSRTGPTPLVCFPTLLKVE